MCVSVVYVCVRFVHFARCVCVCKCRVCVCKCGAFSRSVCVCNVCAFCEVCKCRVSVVYVCVSVVHFRGVYAGGLQ